MRPVLIISFFFFALLDLSQVYVDGGLRFLTKPMIMISLICYFCYETIDRLNGERSQQIFLVALIAALVGDVLLLFENLFMIGLLAFLVMQILYSLSFLQTYKPRKSTNVFRIFLIILCLFVLYNLWPFLEHLQIPVTIYVFAIAAMAYSAFSRVHNIKGYKMVFIGTIFFLISDTALAIGQFMNEINIGKLTVMSSYALAQFLIVEGWLQQYRTNTNG